MRVGARRGLRMNHAKRLAVVVLKRVSGYEIAESNAEMDYFSSIIRRERDVAVLPVTYRE